jgi:predicted nuclease of predicted toxin-antitoxin system
VKLLLDEHFSFRIAEQLRKKGCDVIAAVERLELREMSDDELLRWASRNERAVLTENVQDFLPIHAGFLNHGEQHYGLILTSARKFPRSTAGFGALVTALAKVLSQHPGSAWLRSDIFWL